ncbi:uncharacterized protein LOC114714064 [Neltuma alba]|uniref:uncharacterized protein LOC114714064 n=1 Tax=Neltuma alba TaxID=207710 RepID=UPI0010A4F98C|nr:uncharacterized protein LOC114714064 [Prosopis alba]
MIFSAGEACQQKIHSQIFAISGVLFVGSSIALVAVSSSVSQIQRFSFTAKTGRAYTRIQLKNKYDTLRKEWQLWDRLLRETGLGWDAERNTVSAPDDWWEKKIVEVPGYEKFRERGLQFRAELTQLFGSVAATGPQSWAPSSMTLPSEGVPEDDMEEGSGDSDEILGAPTGISGEFNSVTFNDNSGGSGGNTGMRRENSRGGRSTGGSRPSSSLGVKKKGESMKKKNTATMKIADALSRIAQANENDSQREYEEISEARARKIEEEARAYETSIAGVMEHLNEVDEVVDDPDLFGRCTTLLMREQAAREMTRQKMADEIKIAEKYRKRRNKRINQVAVAVGGYASLHLCKEPQHTSIYTGKAWVRDVLQGHSTRCYNMFRMEREVFFSLCTELQQHGNMPSYDFPTQVQIVCATMAIHNFIRSISISDPGFIQFEQEGSYAEENNDDDGLGSSHIPSSIESSSHMARLRDSIRDQIAHYIRE